jgi:hypothetical protein
MASLTAPFSLPFFRKVFLPRSLPARSTRLILEWNVLGLEMLCCLGCLYTDTVKTQCEREDWSLSA